MKSPAFKGLQTKSVDPEGDLPATRDSIKFSTPITPFSPQRFLQRRSTNASPIRYKSSSPKATLWSGRRTFSTLFCPADWCPRIPESQCPGILVTVYPVVRISFSLRQILEFIAVALCDV